MSDNPQNRSFLKGKTKLLLNLLKVVILLAIAFGLYRATFHNEQFDEQFISAVRGAFSAENIFFILPLFGLIFLNWAFEAWKWQILVTKLEEISFWEAFKGVLTGLTMAFISTTNAGAFFGRVWQLKSETRYHILGGMFLNSLSQNAITYFCGGIGLIYFLSWKNTLESSLTIWLIIAYAILAIGTLVAIFKAVLFIKWFKRFPKIYPYLEMMASYGTRETFKILFISFLRYATYFTQFILILIVFGVDLKFEQYFSGISLVYLAKTMIPNFSFLTDLGIREFSSIQFLGESGFGIPNATIVASTLSLWFINILFPVAIGSIFTWQAKILRKKQSNS
ncbi:MAG: hypothetical protein ACJAWV_000011 [Flammeovirgaceae bacterium]